MLVQNYKLVITGQSQKEKLQLFKMPDDLAEEHDIAAQHPDVVSSMQKELHRWQSSVLKSLTGADYE